MYSKILVPLDGSKTAEKVLPYARHLAGNFKIPVELLAVLDIAEMATHVSAERTRHLDTMIDRRHACQHQLFARYRLDLPRGQRRPAQWKKTGPKRRSYARLRRTAEC